MPLPLALAKARSARRRHESGAALFIVSMTLTVLASVGIYALAAASNEVRTSGYERQNTQTHFLASYGTFAAAHEISSTKAQFYANLMLNPTTRDTCAALAPVPTNTITSPSSLACRRLGINEFANYWGVSPVDAYGGTVPYSPGVTPGSMGPTLTKADLFVELSDPGNANPPPRYGLNLNFCFLQLTVSSTGITQPVFTTPNAAESYGTEGLEVQRSRITAGPVTIGCN